MAKYNLQYRTKECIQLISQKYPCRSELITKLFVQHNLGYDVRTSLPASLYVFGSQGTGKSSVITMLLKMVPHKTVLIDCVECYTSKIIFETVLNELFDHKLKESTNYASYAKCDNARDFIEALKNLDTQKSYVIFFDDAQRLRDMDANVLSVFLRLRELTNLNVCCLFASILPFEKLYPVGSFPMPITLYWPNYSYSEIQTILLSKFELFKRMLIKHFVVAPNQTEIVSLRRIDIINSLAIDFFDNFLNLFLKTFFRTCRDLNELTLSSRDCFLKYCEPVLTGSIEPNDIRMLYKNIASTLKSSVNTIYKRIDQNMVCFCFPHCRNTLHFFI